MKKEIDVDINLLQNEEILLESPSFRNPTLPLFWYPLLWMILATFIIAMLVILYPTNNFLLFNFGIIVLFFITLSFGYLHEMVLRDANGQLFITSKRIICKYGKGLLRYEKKRIEIEIDEISFIRIWPVSIEIAKRNPKGDEMYDGTEEKYIVKFMKKHSISFSLYGSEGEKIKEKIIEILSGITTFSNHPKLKGILLHN